MENPVSNFLAQASAGAGKSGRTPHRPYRTETVENPVSNFLAQASAGAGKPRRAPYRPYRKFRYAFFCLAALVALAVPFVSVNGNALLRMSFLHGRLELLGMVFDATQLYVVPFMIFAFAGLVLLLTALGGRIWCGWGCPQTMFRAVYRDLIQGFLLKLNRNKDKHRPLRLNTLSGKLRRVVGVALFAAVAYLGSANLMWYFVAPAEFFGEVLPHPERYPFVVGFWFALGTFFVIDVTVIKENFCKYVCPYARIQSVFFDQHTALVAYDAKRGNNLDGSWGRRNFKGVKVNEGDCVDCLACVKVCPTGIDIRNGLQLGCIECLECVDACQPVMARRGKENLIRWTTEAAMNGEISRFVRPRTVFYASLIAFCLATLTLLSFNKSQVVMTVNRTSELYYFDEQKGVLENYYVLLLVNDTHEDIRMRFEVQADFPLEIIRTSREFTLYGDEKTKKVLTLSTSAFQGAEGGEALRTVPVELILTGVDRPEELRLREEIAFMVPVGFVGKTP